MNKLDKQFEQLMKEIQLDSPSKDFSLWVMERIQAEAAAQKPSLVEDYQPVISRKVWIILIAAFIALVVYILGFGQEPSQAENPSLWSAIPEALPKIDTKGLSTIWQSATGLFTSIPTMAYLIMLASMALWTLDLLLTRSRHNSADMQVN
jgi:hypothetical protein